MRTSRRRTAAAVSRTLEVKANQAINAHKVAANSQDHTPPPAIDVPEHHRRLLLPAAAAVLVVALIAAGAVALQRESEDQPADTVIVADPPDSWLVPGWLPSGMELWSIDWSAPTGESVADPTMMPQLFGDPDAGEAIYVTSHQYEIAPDTAKDSNVRDQAGQAGPTWNVEEADVGDGIQWTERGVTITALYKGMSEDTAISFLDSLKWRSDDPADGLAPPDEDDPLPLRAEVPSQRASHDISFMYSEGGPVGMADGTGTGLEVHTSASTTNATWYLEGWYLQGAEAGGGERPISSYDEESQHLEVYWPDGRSVVIWARGEAMDHDALERVADSLTVAGEADLEGIRDSVETRIATLPVVASAATSLGTFEVHGDRDFLQMCLSRLSESEPNCMASLSSGGESDDGTAIVSGEWTLDGTWYVAVASKGEHPQLIDAQSTPPSQAPELPAETIADGEWKFRLLQPAPDVESVCTSSDGGSAIGCVHSRPS